MKKTKSIYIPLLALASCATDVVPEPTSPAGDDAARIVVMGGSTAPGVTRADDETFPEPFNIGTCNADRIKILQFRATTTSSGPISAGNLKFGPINDIDLTQQLNYRDKCTTHSMSLSLKALAENWFAFPSVAYSTVDEDKFSLSYSSYSDIKLDLKSVGIKMPELYFGRLLPEGYSVRGGHDAEGMTYKYSTPTTTEEKQLSGKLYRIVSQLNIKLTDVLTTVEKIDIYLSNVPSQIGLYAKHRTALGQSGTDRGYYYPIVEATGNEQHKMEETLVCSVTDFPNQTATFSTFILPSAEGRTVTVKAYLKAGDQEDENKTLELTRMLRASRNYNLDAATSKVYFSADELPVYDAATSKFMSYPNVRVNVSGSFSDIFSEESESNIVIEICPNYDGEHKFEIK